MARSRGLITRCRACLASASHTRARQAVVRRGEIWWGSLPEPTGSGPGFRRPLLIVSANSFNDSRINTVVAAVITSNLRLADAPGNVRLPTKEPDLRKRPSQMFLRSSPWTRRFSRNESEDSTLDCSPKLTMGFASSCRSRQGLTARSTWTRAKAPRAGQRGR